MTRRSCTPRRARVSHLASLLALAFIAAGPGSAQAAQPNVAGSARQLDGSYWQDAAQPAAKSAQAAPSAASALRKWRALTLDRGTAASLAARAPMESASSSARASAATISLPHPDGGFQRFTLVESPVMEPGLAAKHPEIKTYAGHGIDDPTATLRMDITPMGLHASVRSSTGAWYVEPQSKLDQSVYASYHRGDRLGDQSSLREAPLTEPQIAVRKGRLQMGEPVEVGGAGFAPGSNVTITLRDTKGRALDTRIVAASGDGSVSASFQGTRAPGGYAVEAIAASTSGTSNPISTPLTVLDPRQPAAASVGSQLRTYRLALLTDPSYATYNGGSANVTAAKVTLINRVTQIYEDETSIRLVLIDGNDALNLDTAAQMTGANGPCGETACFSASQAATCGSSTLSRNNQVVSLLVGARNFDLGHIAMGNTGGGIASLGAIGGSIKGAGCTGLTSPTGDFFALDYVAHEMGHQFGAHHSFNGITSNCGGGNRTSGTSVEPGSGSSIMAYAGICGADNTQPHSDAYWSMTSFDEITTLIGSAETTLNETQLAVLSGFTTDGLQFTLSYDGQTSSPIIRGSNFTAAGIKAAIEAIPGWPSGGTVTVSALTQAGFTVSFGGTLAGKQTSVLVLGNCTGGCTGKVGELAAGGLTTHGGTVSAKVNSAPVVTAPAGYTIPLRTPFSLTGSATDPDGDVLTYMWEQTDFSKSGLQLTNNSKVDGPLFRQFGVAAAVTTAGSLQYSSPGENMTTTDPTRVFPDMAQILVDNTNAATGSCPTASSPPTAAQIDCFSEFLPTASYVGYSTSNNASPVRLNFRLTARDGHGGVGSAATVLTLASGTGPFRVTAPNSAVTMLSEVGQAVTWDVAGTSASPVNASQVRITLSTDGGASFPYVLAAAAPNSGSATVRLPNVATSKARVKVEAVGNIFFDVSHADFSIRLYADVNGDGAVNCTDMALVRARMGTRSGQANFDASADVNGDGVVDVRDLSIVSQHLAAGSSCK